MPEPGYATPEQAATGDIPSRYVHVIGVSVEGDDAVVAFLTNDPPAQEPYISTAHRRDGMWHGGSGTGGYGFGGHYGAGGDVAYIFEPVPEGVVEVVAALGERRVRAPIESGHLFVAFWGLDVDDRISVEQLVFSNGETRAAEPGWPGTPSELRMHERLRELMRRHGDELRLGDLGEGVQELRWLDE